MFDIYLPLPVAALPVCQGGVSAAAQSGLRSLRQRYPGTPPPSWDPACLQVTVCPPIPPHIPHFLSSPPPHPSPALHPFSWQSDGKICRCSSPVGYSITGVGLRYKRWLRHVCASHIMLGTSSSIRLMVLTTYFDCIVY